MVSITIDVLTIGVFRPHERKEIKALRQKRSARVNKKHEHQMTLQNPPRHEDQATLDELKESE